MELVSLIARLALFAILAVAAVGKLLDREGSRRAIRDFGIPAPFVGAFAFLLPLAEAVFAISLLFVATSWIGALGALLLLVAFILGMLIQVMKGQAPDCHCFGQIHSEPVGVKSLVRNFVIALIPAYLVIAGRGGQGYALGETDVQIASNAILAAVAVVSFIAFISLMSREKELKQLRRRVELLELADGSGTAVERDAAGNPQDSIPIGAPVPKFSHPNAAGRIVTDDTVFPFDKFTLAVFVSPSCGPCGSMVPDFKKWMAEFSGRLEFAFFSKGTVEENRDKFGEEILERIVLQKDMEISHRFFVKWTPTAVLVSPDGKIASRLAIGDSAIGDLITTLRNTKLDSPNQFIVNGSKPGRVKIGEKVPEFELPAIGAETIRSDSFIGSTTLAIFITSSCPHCGELVEAIRKWESSAERNGTNAVLFSEGDEDAQRAHGLSTPIVLDADHKIATQMGMYGAPSAVLVDETGRIASETAVGAPMIWSLIGREAK